MQRFVYTPRVEAYIRLEAKKQTIDITEDIISGSVTRRLNQISEANFVLQNKNGKYTTLNQIQPMDRIVVKMKRVGQAFTVFSGYVDDAPYYQLYPGPVNVSASCTLKLLQNTYFDPGVPLLTTMFAQLGWNYNPTTGTLNDQKDPSKFGDLDIKGGFGDLIAAVLTQPQLGHWDPDHVIIYDLPDKFIDSIANLNREANEEFLEIFEEQRNYLRKLLRGKGGKERQDNEDTDNRKPVHGNLKPIKAAQIIIEAGFTGRDKNGDDAAVVGLAIAMGESSLKTDAHNENTDGSFDHGIFQINSVHKPANKSLKEWQNYLSNPRNNADEAHGLYTSKDNGWTDWVVYNEGIYKEYLDQAEEAVRKYRFNKDLSDDDDGGTKEPEPNRRPVKKHTFMYPIAPYPGYKHNVTAQGYFGNDRGDHIHAGIDIAANKGAKLVACVDGTVTTANQPSGAGKYVVLKKKNSSYTFNYFHMDTITVRNGQSVIQGQQLGTVGSTGTTSGFNHLHFEAHPRGGFGYSSAVDPDKFCKPAWLAKNYVTEVDDPSGDTGGDDSSGTGDGDDAIISHFFQLQLQGGNELSQSLAGKRALANDIPLLKWISTAVQASGRVFCSHPNGDFLAFYPDKFGYYERTPYFRISDIEIIDLNINRNDRELTTHVFASGSYFVQDIYNQIASMVASVEEPAFDDFVNVNPSAMPGQNKKKDSKFDVAAFLKRYGARPMPVEAPEIRHPILLWLFAWMTFTDQWAKQFTATGRFTFMPELFPGGLVAFGDRITMYVESVTHSFDLQGGFSTSAELSAPSALDESFDWMPQFQEGDFDTGGPGQQVEQKTYGLEQGGDMIITDEELGVKHGD